VQLRRAGLERLLRIGHVRQGLVVDVDALEGILRRVTIGGDDRDHGLPLEEGHVHGHRIVIGHALDVGQRAEDLDRLRAGHHVATDEDRLDARHLEGAPRVDAANARMGIGRAPHGHVQGPGHVEVVAEEGEAAQQALVLLAPDAGADPGVLHDLAASARWRR
jgi:hypothetical protein